MRMLNRLERFSSFLCLLLFSFVSFSCVNIINNNKASCSIKIGKEVQNEISRTMSFSPDTVFTVEGLLYKKDKIAIKEKSESTLDKLSDVTFIFKDIPFGDDYKIKINLSLNDDVIYSASSSLLTITEDNALINLDLAVSPVYKNITYNLDGGSLPPNAQTIYAVNSNINLVTPYRENSEFLGWYLTPSFTGEKIEKLNKDNYYGDVTLYASWRLFDTLDAPRFSHNGNVVGLSTSVDYNEEITLSYEGLESSIYYTIDGTEPSRSNGTLYSSNNPIVIDKDTTIKAIAIKEGYISSKVNTIDVKVIEYNVRFDNNGHGTVNTPSLKIHKGPLPESSIKEISEVGHTFRHWEDMDGNIVDSSYIVTKDTTIKAIWDINQYRITYETNTDEKIISKTVDYNYSLTEDDLRTNLTKEHNDFIGWFIDKEAINTGFHVTNDITLTAKWNPWDTVSDVTISPYLSSLDYGDEIILETVTNGATISYTLDGTDPLTSSTSKVYTSSLKVDKDIKIRTIAYKDHMVNSGETSLNVTMKLYTLKFNNGGHGSTPGAISGKKKGDAITLPPSLTENQFHFLGWNINGTVYKENEVITIDPKTAKNGEITVTALWEGVVEPVTFSIVGDVDYLDSVTLSTATQGASIYYTTDGSEPSVSSIPYTSTPIEIDKDMTIRAIATKSGMQDSIVKDASFTIKTYTVIYDNGGHGTAPGAISGKKKGDAITLPPSLTENQFHFLGWDLNGKVYNEREEIIIDPKDARNGEITITAKWEGIVEEVTFSVTGEVDYKDGLTLSTLTPNATIYYTTNGSVPTTSSTPYTGTILIDKAMTIRAIATKSGMQDSKVTESSYTIKTYTVTFNNGGHGQTTPSSIPNLKRGDKVVKPQDLTDPNSGFEFSKEWYTDSKCQNKWDFNTSTIDRANITLYAKWNDVAPQAVSSFTAGLNSTRDKILLSWTNPSDKDIKRVIINSTNAALSNKAIDVNGKEGQSSSFEVPLTTVLDKGLYEFNIKTEDNGGNACLSSNIKQASIKLPKINDFTIPNYRYNQNITVYVTGENFNSTAITSSDIKITGTKVSIRNITVNSDTELQFTLPAYTTPITDTITVSAVGSSTKQASFEIKAEYALSDIVMSDKTILVKEKVQNYKGKAKPVAVIFSVKSGNTPAKGVGLYVKDCKWSSKNTDIPAITDSGTTKTDATDLDGSNNWTEVQRADSAGSADPANNYPAFHFANNYGTTYFKGNVYENGWYLPSRGELINTSQIAEYDSLRDTLKARFPETNVKYLGTFCNLWSSNQLDANNARTYWYPHDSIFNESKPKIDQGSDVMSAPAIRQFN